MNASDLRTDAARDAWPDLREENAGGARACDFEDHQYRRRVEVDRSWTVYHVFTGIPAHVNGDSMVGLSQSEATKSMLSLNFCSSERRKERIAARFFAAPEKP
ncbi:hypothetical protein EN817_28015 [Mesorhizobium sp. M3A.F.Ca.ET.174.01.1.1]|uniref:hypothetical protein n=1 Tax=unclassified Mesorhizobium TaxID=325217 RepID=UPI001093AD0D|nr:MULTISPECIES: hypothetical protein [unclassified Mesorhizobium]TGS71528.1 hypothetical protein EN844_00540 [Mesorhizobium sp. M3A.F.Ca.ET.201.01.1.1]TGS82389.1 hypothetical protein EN818_27465 [Mesorhizobium sp. M3A.F.Ca.ET.175.01.1.1]TGT22211.1 hypothetical protein EN817_28015 [Mesorhizobium sp. M3A.F.Ca.ET.174.01.1.1]